ncbi:Cytochrome oxidase assembly protein ShyY1 [Quadrisphaera granulorum]|uniref:SURF1-like protein n=1 Tax=Quadrisphaera granulorum TaxID=317664 RepID=A0A315ZYC3_9ACTN|nr:SURF1 family protein [Quadrisphaera granulorum]PWJ50676.1 cytochrome oxidase assembly protein ShyY1 [Quadrisphaera granulorum]SZE97924.1 Cytochrome oxidase assembly protein ShyY1 [Quadrisphaera granulorum]
MHRLLLQRRWLRAIALALLFSLACLALARWQWDRRVERVAAIDLVEANYHRSPVPLATALPDFTSPLPRDRTWTPVAVSGTYLAQATLLVRHRPHEGQGYGYEVLVPLRLDDGHLLVVDRGWLPPDPTSLDGPSVVPAPPAGRVDVVVRLRPSEPVDGRDAPPGQVQAIDLAGSVASGIAAAIGATAATVSPEVITAAYGELEKDGETPAPTAAPRAADAPSLDEGPHLGYTVQWLLFAIGAWVFLVVHMRRAAYEADVAAGRRERRAEVVVYDPNRAPTDEEVEDAAVEAMLAAARRESERQLGR